MTSNQRDELDEIIWKADVDHGVCETKELNGSYDQEWTRCFFCASRRRHTRSKRTGVQTCALPISSHVPGLLGPTNVNNRAERGKLRWPSPGSPWSPTEPRPGPYRGRMARIDQRDARNAAGP